MSINPGHVFDSDSNEPPLTLKRILQHYAVYTNQTKDNMTYLLKLLKRHQPKPHYDSLPSSGMQLLWIDGSDVDGFPQPAPAVISVTDAAVPPPTTAGPEKKKKKRPLKLPKVIELDDGGKFMCFGLEAALKGESPGLVYKNADLIQLASLYRCRPRCVTPRMRK